MQKRHFFVSSFSETRTVIWVSGQLFEIWLKLWPVSSKFVKICVSIRKKEKNAKKYCKKQIVFSQKNHRKSSSFKKVNLEQFFCAIFQFMSRFQDFWNREIWFLKVKKIFYGYAYFFDCKLPRQIIEANLFGLCTISETRPNYWPWWI